MTNAEFKKEIAILEAEADALMSDYELSDSAGGDIWRMENIEKRIKNGYKLIKGIIMEPEKQVCSLELAKRLKELGVEQESLFYWVWFDTKFDICYKDSSGRFQNIDEPFKVYDMYPCYYSAFTVAELGEALPMCVKKSKGLPSYAKSIHFIKFIKEFNNWRCFIDDNYGYLMIGDGFREKTEADSRAKMRIFLIENGLIKV